jgi:hypothetical protein
MEGSCSTGQSPQWAVVPMEEEEDAVIMPYLLLESIQMFLSSSYKSH